MGEGNGLIAMTRGIWLRVEETWLQWPMALNWFNHRPGTSLCVGLFCSASPPSLFGSLLPIAISILFLFRFRICIWPYAPMAMALTLATSRISGLRPMEGNTSVIPRLTRESHGYGQCNKMLFIDATRIDGGDSLGQERFWRISIGKKWPRRRLKALMYAEREEQEDWMREINQGTVELIMGLGK